MSDLTRSDIAREAAQDAIQEHVRTMWVRDCKDDKMGPMDWWDSLTDGERADYLDVEPTDHSFGWRKG